MPQRSSLHKLPVFALALTALLFTACASPIGVKELSPPDANRALVVNVLNTEQLSVYTARTLQWLGLAAQYETDAPAVLKQLNDGFGDTGETERLLALSELCFAHALKSGDRSYYLAAAVYAWSYLTTKAEAWTGTPFDLRVRFAGDLYNRGLALGMMGADGRHIDITPRSVPTFFGSIELQPDDTPPVPAGYSLEEPVSLTDLEVHGFRNRYRQRGIGAPLAARVRAQEGVKTDAWIAPPAKLPVTMIVHFDRDPVGRAPAQVTGRFDFIDPDENGTTDLGGHRVALETDPTAALAYRLQDSPLWDFEIAGFRRGDFSFDQGLKSGRIYLGEPYRPDLIPLVFVHGTASSPARWAEMANDLSSDPLIAKHFQFWYFLYDSGNPIAYSSMLLRDQLLSAQQHLDPKHENQAFQNMVLVGHSQGGLLVKMMTVTSGDAFWNNVSKMSFAQARMKMESSEQVQKALFVEPLPFVKRVVFICTPQRGAKVAENWIGNLARRLVNFPSTLVHIGTSLMTLQASGALVEGIKMPTSVDNMRGDNPFNKTLASLPIDSHVHAHSIIAVKGNGPIETGDDGVVRYSSAHIEPVDSELVVRWNHSVQGRPEAIEEVRRILREHLRALGISTAEGTDESGQPRS